MTKCTNCSNDKDLIIINVESSDSTWDDWDQDITYKCPKCGKEFHYIW